MATTQLAESLLGGLTEDVRRVLTDLFRQLIPNWRFGPSDQKKSENFRAYYVESTTATSTGTEFSIAHGIGVAPYLAVAILPLDSSNYVLPRLRTTRPADNQRVYLSSPDSTGAIFRLLLEG